MEITINDKTYHFKEIIEDFYKIHKIVTGLCPYCERENIKKCEDKIRLIKKITKKYFRDGNGQGD